MTQEDSIGNADPSSVADPAHHSSGNADHTTSTGTKSTGVVEALLDPEFLPTTAKAPILRKLQSAGVLLILVTGAMFAGRLLISTEILQVQWPLFFALGATIAGSIFVIAGDIDWWELLLAYWFLSLPAGVVAGALLVMMGEQATSMTDVE